jgi:hypothetical protein
MVGGEESIEGGSRWIQCWKRERGVTGSVELEIGAARHWRRSQRLCSMMDNRMQRIDAEDRVGGCAAHPPARTYARARRVPGGSGTLPASLHMRTLPYSSEHCARVTSQQRSKGCGSAFSFRSLSLFSFSFLSLSLCLCLLRVGAPEPLQVHVHVRAPGAGLRNDMA